MQTVIFRLYAKTLILEMIFALFLALVLPPTLFSQQISVSRIEQMPNFPQPYHMRDWKRVAMGYDSLVFNFNLTGQYLPLIWWNTNPVNYPNHWSFGLHTVVGTTVPFSAEAINVLPAVISASLVGIDKSNQNGNNWVLMCEEWFNRRPEENVYLNHPVASSGSDWWYDTMPNVFFYQLYSMYPGTGDFDSQFTWVAERWYQAVRAMGGSATPWDVPYMNYRGWYLASMTPNTGGVPEPEAAGAIGWLLYMAYRQTGIEKYRMGAEWCLEFLNSWQTNPSYELQLSYGTYVAARMNAELGTLYDVEKFVNWCFDVGPLRNWGAILGNWGGYDCYGLIGEVSGNDYAFSMNTFEQIGALVPMVRYDDRFARAIGKWVLNAANALRLFYPNYLPDENQDSEEWAHQYDPHSYIAHEAMREEYQGYSPYATGDAISGGWGMTNLTLYSSSHVGILGGIIDTTNIEGILKLNLLKTDYFHAPAYPSYLLYNPYPLDTTIVLDLPPGNFDVYDAVANQFILTGVSGTVAVLLPADAARILVFAPAGGQVQYVLDRMLIDGVVVDYRSGQTVQNYPPRIKGLVAKPATMARLDTTMLYCTAEDRENAPLVYQWQSIAGQFLDSGKTVRWVAPIDTGNVSISVIVEDDQGAADTAMVSVRVVSRINHAPQIIRLRASPRKIDLGAVSTVTCEALDPDDDPISFIWSATSGSFVGSGDSVQWLAPSLPGNYTITCIVEDTLGAVARDSVVILVRDFSGFQPGNLIAYYPLNGTAEDGSGNGHHGSVYGAVPVEDRFGNPGGALRFDGIDDRIQVPNHPLLNFGNAISINFWMKVEYFYSREAFPLSHGSWQNRWKVSIIPSHHLRWTIKTDQGIFDLDTETEPELNRWYNVTVFYDGSDFEVYLDGELDNFGTASGTLLNTTYDMTFAQMLPGNTSYNFKGVLDEVRIFDYGLSVQEIQDLYQQPNALSSSQERVPGGITLEPCFPNPFNSETTIRFYLPEREKVTLTVYDLSGRVVARLIRGEMLAPGYHTRRWSARQTASGLYFVVLKGKDDQRSRKIILVR